MGCLGKSDEIAKDAHFLASDNFGFVKGVERFVGGRRAQT
jgi:hypothetical protein